MSKSVGELIREVRLSHRMSQAKLAEGICTQALISKIEKGETVPSIDISHKICSKLNIVTANA